MENEQKNTKYFDQDCLKNFLFQITLLLIIEFGCAGHILKQNSDLFTMNDPPERRNVSKYDNFTNFKTQKYTLTENAVFGIF